MVTSPQPTDRWRRREALPATSVHVLSYEQLRDEPLTLLDQVRQALGVCPDVSVFGESSRIVFRGEPAEIHPDAVDLIAQVREGTHQVHGRGWPDP
jgi:hypothetical protein